MLPRIRLTNQLHLSVILGIALLLPAGSAFAQPRVLADFETLDGWHAVTTESSTATLSSVEGETGRAPAMDFDLSRAYGSVIARRNFALELPDNHQFTFDP